MAAPQNQKPNQKLNPTPAARLAHLLRPGWAHTAMARRVAAAALVLVAAVAALRPDPADARERVLVAAHDLTPGVKLTADDVRVESRSTATLPDGFRSDVTTVVGATLAGPVRRGEMFTDLRVLGPRLADASAGPDSRLVPVHLTDAALLGLVRPGDVVDVVTVAAEEPGSQSDQRPRTLADAAVVVLVTPKADTRDGVVLVALPVRSATEVAATALTQAVTLTFH